MRTKKTVGDETYGYVWQDGKLISESYEYDPENTQYYIYDENGSPVAWSYLDEYYYYIKNQQGDILGFTDSEGNVVVTYEYDAWGNLLSYTGTSYLAEYNSLRYRGYAYDNETGLYYLQSRYYDPKVGRFLNADDTGYLGASGTVLGYNLYTYCENNTANLMDHSGCLSVSAKKQSNNNLKILINLSDTDIKNYIFLRNLRIIWEAAKIEIVAIILGAFSYGVACVIISAINVVKTAIDSSISATIDRFNKGNGARIEFTVKYGYSTVWYYVRKWSYRVGYYYVKQKTTIPYAYISKLPSFKWL